MKKPCSDFQASILSWRTDKDTSRLHCRHGNACHYEHRLPGYEDQYTFPYDHVQRMIAERTGKAVPRYRDEGHLAAGVPADPAAESEPQATVESDVPVARSPKDATFRGAPQEQQETEIIPVSSPEFFTPELTGGETVQERLARYQRAVIENIGRGVIAQRQRHQQQGQA